MNQQEKILKQLVRINTNMFCRLLQEIRNVVEYGEDLEEVKSKLSNFANPKKWEYCGLLNKEDTAILKFSEHLMDENSTEISSLQEWKPIKDL